MRSFPFVICPSPAGLPITSRKLEVSAPKGPGNLLVVGSSNAKRLVAALAAKGIPVGSALCNSWRATKQSVTLMAEHVWRELVSGSYTAVIFQLLDNNLYFASTEDGRLIPASRDNDGFYHVEGDLTIAAQNSSPGCDEALRATMGSGHRQAHGRHQPTAALCERGLLW